MMTTANVLAVIGLVLTVAGMGGVLWWRLSVKISANTAALHKRIDETREKYVRRDDLGDHIQRIEANQKQLLDGMAAMNLRMDNFMIHFAKMPPPQDRNHKG